MTPDKNRVLFCVVGTSPAVVSETLFALAKPTEAGVAAWVPNKIICVTTTEGEKRIRASLLGAGGWLANMVADYPELGLAHFMDPTATEVVVIRSRTGEPLSDIRSLQDNNDAGETIFGTLRGITEKPRTQVYVSLAGGRKTMSFLTGFAMSILGRPDDRLLHVLLSPDGVEGIADFGYPPRDKTPGTLRRWVDGKQVLEEIDLSQVRIDLAEVPFLLLSHFIDKKEFDKLQNFEEVMRACKRLAADRSFKLSIIRKDRLDELPKIRFRGVECQLSAAEAFCIFLAEKGYLGEENGLVYTDGGPIPEFEQWRNPGVDPEKLAYPPRDEDNISVWRTRIKNRFAEVFSKEEVEILQVQMKPLRKPKRCFYLDPRLEVEVIYENEKS